MTTYLHHVVNATLQREVDLARGLAVGTLGRPDGGIDAVAVDLDAVDDLFWYFSWLEMCSSTPRS